MLDTCFLPALHSGFFPLLPFKMAAAAVLGVLFALTAVMFNFSIHKIDEGKNKHCSTCLDVIGFVSFYFARNNSATINL